MCTDKRTNILQGGLAGRSAVFLFIFTVVVFNLIGCSTLYRNYLDQEVDSAADVEKARTARGSINVILLPGCAASPGAQDTLFSCLKLSRDVEPESVQLPLGESFIWGM